MSWFLGRRCSALCQEDQELSLPSNKCLEKKKKKKVSLVNTNQSSWLWRLLYLSCLKLNLGLGIISSFLHLSSLRTGQSLKQGNRSFLSCCPCEVARTIAVSLPAVLRRGQAEQNGDVMTEMQSALTNRAFTWGHGALISRVVECDKQPSKCCDFPSSSMEASQLERKWGGEKSSPKDL